MKDYVSLADICESIAWHSSLVEKGRNRAVSQEMEKAFAYDKITKLGG